MKIDRTNLTIPLKWGTSFLAAILAFGVAPNATAESELEKRKAYFESRLSELEAPIAKLEAQYSQHLERQHEQHKQAGELKAILAIEEEINAPGAAPEISAFPALVKAQKVFLKRRNFLAEEQAKKRLSLMSDYKTSLDALQIKLTKQDNIAGAKLVLVEVERVQALTQDASSAGVSGSRGSQEPLTLTPNEVRNELPGDPSSGERRTYIVETDGTEGTLSMDFEHPAFATASSDVEEMALEFTIATTPQADTHHELLVFVGDREIGSKEGAGQGETVSIALDLKKLPSEAKLELELRCGGTNAAVIQKGENGPRLKVRFGK